MWAHSDAMRYWIWELPVLVFAVLASIVLRFLNMMSVSGAAIRTSSWPCPGSQWGETDLTKKVDVESFVKELEENLHSCELQILFTDCISFEERPGTWPSDIDEDHVVPLSEEGASKCNTRDWWDSDCWTSLAMALQVLDQIRKDVLRTRHAAFWVS